MKLPKLYSIGIRYPIAVLIAALIFTIISVFLSQKLHIVYDLTSLLPQKLESVKGLEELKEKFGGLGYLMVTVESSDTARTEAFAEKFVQKIKQHPSVQYTDFHPPVDYFKDRQWLYLDIDDLKEVERRIERTLQLEKKGVSPVFNDLMDFADPEDRPDLTLKDIRKKYEKRFGWDTQKALASADGTFLTVRVKLRENPQNFGATQRFMEQVRRIEAEVKQEGHFQDVAVGYTGTYQKMLEQSNLMREEAAGVSILVFVLLLAILVLYFGRFSGAILVSLPVMLGVAWTGGFVALFLGHLNVVTSFAAGILAGLGSDYGIYLLSRYYEEREKGVDFFTACDLAFAKTGKGTYLSMLTTVGAFGSLLFSKFRLFVEFGFVGAVGVVLNYIAIMLLIPATLSLTHRFQKAKKWNSQPRVWYRVLQRWNDALWNRVHDLLMPKRKFYGLSVIIILVVLSAATLPSMKKIYFDDGQIESYKLPSYRLSDRVSAISSVSLNPTIFMVPAAQEETAVRHLEDLLAKDVNHDLVFNRVLGLSSFVPEKQEEKKEILEKIRHKVSDLRSLKGDDRKELLEGLEKSIRAGDIRKDNLPEEVRRVFTSIRQSETAMISVYPSFARGSSETIRRYHDGIFDLKKSLSVPFTVADGTFISDDIIKLIEGEAPRGMLLLLLFIAATALISVRPFKTVVLILIHLYSALIVLAGILWLAGIRLNILNIAVIPIVLGTGIDCFVHFNERFFETRDLDEAMRTKVPAVFASNVTSAVGFAGLILTSSAGLRSAGWICVLGIFVVTFFGVYVYPRCLNLFKINTKGPLPKGLRTESHL